MIKSNWPYINPTDINIYETRDNWPKISIVTPSYNQGAFIEDTILSVLGQNYPNLEYIIIDGGSTDNSVEIIKKYEGQLAYWVSEKDNGQSHAINKGFEKATGEIFAWLNSDDMYMQNVLVEIANIFKNKSTCIVCGECIHFRNDCYGLTARGSNVVQNSLTKKLCLIDFIIQPSTFWNASTWNYVGKLDQNMHFGFDWDWFLRAERKGVDFYPIQKPISLYRIHDQHKSGIGGLNRQKELLYIYDKYSPKLGAILFKILTNEKLKAGSLPMRAFRYILKLIGDKVTTAKALKFYKPFKYKKFTNEEIDSVNEMIG